MDASHEPGYSRQFNRTEVAPRAGAWIETGGGRTNVNGTPVMQTGSGAVAIVPMDYVYWSPGVAQLVSNTGTQGQIWITGSASQLATANLASRGWQIVPKAGARLEK